ncbi:MAG TPA: XdhC family protein, partial [Fimbriimonas sp.]|nr:XdhC family protein [Fimbriimonas sp.]
LGNRTFDLAEGLESKVKDCLSFTTSDEDDIVLVELVRPPRDLTIFGAGADAVPIVHIASELGYRISVVDHRDSYAVASRFPLAEVVHSAGYEDFSSLHLGADSAVVVMTHNYLNDKKILQNLAGSSAAYVGLLGPKARADRIVAELREEGTLIVPELRAPVGLDLGADGPQEIALSILSEIQAFFRHTQAVPLRDIDGPIHSNGDRRACCPSR